jgi:hypothetical protein
LDELDVIVIFDGATTDPAFLRHILTTLSGLDPMAPTYWGPHERKRLPWDIDAILAFVADDKVRYSRFLRSSITLWRTKPPRFQGALNTADQTVNRVTFKFSPGPSAKHLRAVYEATERLVHSLPTIYAHVHPIWRAGADVEGFTEEQVSEYVWGVHTNEHDMLTKGVPSIQARTWFGPLLVARIGRDLLLGVDGAVEEEGGIVRVDLAAEPWNASFKELAPRKAEVIAHLRPSGMFMDVECDDRGGFKKRDPAPRWTPPDWVLRAKRKDETS